MKLEVENIGVFGVSFSSGFDQTWVNIWRKPDKYSFDFFSMLGDDDPVEEQSYISLEEGERVIAKAIEGAKIEQWQEQYGSDAPDKISGLAWTLDIDDLNEADIAMYSGNGGIPPRAQFDALIEAVRIVFPEFARGMECFES